MSKEVKRYDAQKLKVWSDETGKGFCVVEASDYEALRLELAEANADFVRIANERDALLAERDALLRQVDTLTEWYSNSLDVINEITAALPGAHYMDPPDGGDVSVPEQVRRMAKDAERYRWLRDAEELPFNLMKTEMMGATLDAAIDAALQGEQP